MKHLRSFLLLLAVVFSINAQATQYIIIKQTWAGRIRFIYVSKPANLKKWYHDSQNDIYYRAKNGFGIPMKIVKPRNCNV